MHKSRKSIDKQQAAQMGNDAVKAKIEKMLKGCEHDGSFIPVSEVKRLMRECLQFSHMPSDENQVEPYLREKFNIPKTDRISDWINPSRFTGDDICDMLLEFEGVLRRKWLNQSQTKD